MQDLDDATQMKPLYGHAIALAGLTFVAPTIGPHLFANGMELAINALGVGVFAVCILVVWLMLRKSRWAAAQVDVEWPPGGEAEAAGKVRALGIVSVFLACFYGAIGIFGLVTMRIYMSNFKYVVVNRILENELKTLGGLGLLLWGIAWVLMRLHYVGRRFSWLANVALVVAVLGWCLQGWALWMANQPGQ